MLTRLTLVLCLVALICATAVTTASATAPPVGALPAGPTAKVHMKKGQIVTISLPHGVHGRVWRIKGSVNGTILREVSERDRGSKLEVTFKAVGKGMTVVRFGLTRGETARAFLGRRYAVRVR
ncbi:MAG TPA: hypothetical protein VGF46_02255 [Gaiellales bacterium]|jgi:hypothetical protein